MLHNDHTLGQDFTEEKPEAQRGQVTCPRSHNYYMVETGLEYWSLTPEPLVLITALPLPSQPHPLCLSQRLHLKLSRRWGGRALTCRRPPP